MLSQSYKLLTAHSLLYGKNRLQMYHMQREMLKVLTQMKNIQPSIQWALITVNKAQPMGVIREYISSTNLVGQQLSVHMLQEEEFQVFFFLIMCHGQGLLGKELEASEWDQVAAKVWIRDRPQRDKRARAYYLLIPASFIQRTLLSLYETES